MTAALRLPATRPGSRIMSVGSYRPSRVVANDEIAARIDSSDEWIRERTGIIERRFAAYDESVVDMAVAAAGKALANAGVAPEAIGMVLLATVTHPYQTPSAAAEVSDRLGTRKAGALDIGAACAGFCYGLGLADTIVRTGTAEHVLVIGVEKLTDFVSPTDRGAAFIFADGAGAVVVGPSDHPGIGPVVWGADGSQKDAITMTQSWIEYRDEPAEQYPVLTMKGQQVFRWAVGEISKVCTEALEAAGITSDDLVAFVPHQANMRITDAMVRALKLPEHVVVARDIATTGNTSAASVPLALDALLQSTDLPSGGLALLVGFGAGLAYAAQVVELP
ncbi:MAG: ketoacyl-ACP synthase III [Actinomycetales bacterium]|nr:ketoacyl-ACP synthase III [Actinomycetales bacterium]